MLLIGGHFRARSSFPLFAFALIFAALTACGGGGGSGDSGEEPSETVQIGVFVDSAVEGADFETETRSGTTNTAGEFEYVESETVTFLIGQLQFPTVPAADFISPNELGANGANPMATATNIARLLQSLDADGNPYNGISIPSTAAATAAPIDFDVSEGDFETNTSVLNLVANSGSVNTTLISVDNVLVHLYQLTGLDEFTNLVVGKQLVLQDTNGNPDTGTQLVVHANGTVSGFTPSGDVELVWHWQDEFFCRSGTSPLDCQPVSFHESVATFVREYGTGISVSYIVQ